MDCVNFFSSFLLGIWQLEEKYYLPVMFACYLFWMWLIVLVCYLQFGEWQIHPSNTGKTYVKQSNKHDFHPPPPIAMDKLYLIVICLNISLFKTFYFPLIFGLSLFYNFTIETLFLFLASVKISKRVELLLLKQIALRMKNRDGQ